MKSGIYLIKNMVNGKVYVGSTVNLKGRRRTHFYFLRKNKHHNVHLQAAFNKYGEKNFEYYIIAHYPEDKLLKREDFYINYFQSMNRNNGYNIEKAERTVTSEETKRKISIAVTIYRKQNYQVRRHQTEETKRKISDSLKTSPYSNLNKPMSDAQKEKLSIALTGKKKPPRTKEHNLNIAKSLMGKNNPNYGKPVSPEQKIKISESLKEYCKTRPAPTEEHKKNLSIAITEWHRLRKLQLNQTIAHRT